MFHSTNSREWEMYTISFCTIVLAASSVTDRTWTLEMIRAFFCCFLFLLFRLLRDVSVCQFCTWNFFFFTTNTTTVCPSNCPFTHKTLETFGPLKWKANLANSFTHVHLDISHTDPLRASHWFLFQQSILFPCVSVPLFFSFSKQQVNDRSFQLVLEKKIREKQAKTRIPHEGPFACKHSLDIACCTSNLTCFCPKDDFKKASQATHGCLL